MSAPREAAVIVDRVATDRGELVLRRAGDAFEIVSNGTFLMDTRDGRSERLLVTAALDRCPAPARVLVAGLGVGFSLNAALSDSRVSGVTAVEIEPALLRWHATHLAAYSGDALGDPRVEVVVCDVLDHLRTTRARYDAICLDVDNGPDWTVTPSNRSLYDDAGTALLASRLAPGGVLSVWLAAPSAAYRRTVARRLQDVISLEVPVERGAPDVVLLGRRPFG